MAQTLLTVKDVSQPFAAIAALAANFVWTAGDAVNGNSFLCTGRELLIAHNTGAGARTITISGVADAFGRSVDIGPYSIGAGLYSVFPQGLTMSKGWMQTNRQIYIAVEHAEVELCVLRLP
jgi:hypothetical protein